jgi:hypothetical protein
VILNREPTLIIQTISGILAVIVATGPTGLTAEQAALIIAAVTALLGVFNALLVRPVAPPAFIALVGAGAALLAGYGLDVSQQVVGAVTAAVVSVLALLTRAQVTPIDPPISS